MADHTAADLDRMEALEKALQACVQAASDDKVEDFSEVSNAADAARAALAPAAGAKRDLNTTHNQGEMI